MKKGRRQERAFEKCQFPVTSFLRAYRAQGQENRYSESNSRTRMEKLEGKFTRLLECIDAHDADGVQRAVFDLGAIRNNWAVIPDEVVERLLTLLRSESMYKSDLAGHLLNFFEFESPQLSERSKWLCVGFLTAHGNEFAHVHSRQVVAELREDGYLRPDKS